MSFGWSWFILFMLFFGLPGLLYAFLYLKHAHGVMRLHTRLFASLLFRIALTQPVLAAGRFGVLLLLFHFCARRQAVETVVMTSWTLLPEMIWLVYRIGVMVEEARNRHGTYMERVIKGYLHDYTRWTIRTQAVVCVCVTSAMVIAIMLQWGEFGSGSDRQTAINWTTVAGLAAGTLATILLTRFTEPLVPAVDPTMVTQSPVPTRDESRLPGRDDMDDEIERWRSTR